VTTQGLYDAASSASIEIPRRSGLLSQPLHFVEEALRSGCLGQSGPNAQVRSREVDSKKVFAGSSWLYFKQVSK